MIDDYIKLKAEIVNGKCPTCNELTILVGLTPEYYRCISCGADLQQHINGKISYIPTLSPKTLRSNVNKYFNGES
tara:strand:+ start:246 stop:470 length:225 start_codon:yes stop_codon:yes gene_type:complete